APLERDEALEARGVLDREARVEIEHRRALLGDQQRQAAATVAAGELPLEVRCAHAPVIARALPAHLRGQRVELSRRRERLRQLEPERNLRQGEPSALLARGKLPGEIREAGAARVRGNVHVLQARRDAVAIVLPG